MLLGEELRLSLRIFWRVALVLYVAAVLATFLNLSSDAPYFMWGLAGVAFNQLSFVGRAWAAVAAALILLLVLDADRTGKPTLSSAFRGFAEPACALPRRCPRLPFSTSDGASSRSCCSTRSGTSRRSAGRIHASRA